MLTTQHNRRSLTEDWPDDEANFELEAFAHRLRGGRPELSPPALDRIAAKIQDEIDRQMPRDPSQTLRARFAARVVSTERSLRPRLMRIAPLAAAACVLVGVGIWLLTGSAQQGGTPGGSPTPTPQFQPVREHAPEHAMPTLPAEPGVVRPSERGPEAPPAESGL